MSMERAWNNIDG